LGLVTSQGFLRRLGRLRDIFHSRIKKGLSHFEARSWQCRLTHFVRGFPILTAELLCLVYAYYRKPEQAQCDPSGTFRKYGEA